MNVKKTDSNSDTSNERTVDTYAGALELEDQDEIEIEPSSIQQRKKKSN